jgi:glycosyltransferase involved in cell wall biosynthesis
MSFSIPSLTVAIPTMRRWAFLEKSLPVYLSHSLVEYVLICDETGEDIDAIQASQWGKHPKLIFRKNPKRLGIYHNKRQCIELAPTEWVAVLDSDNFFGEEFFDTLGGIWANEDANPSHFYACGKGLFVNENGTITNPIDGFGGTKLSKEAWNDFFNKPKWNYMLNDGNWIVHTSSLACLPKDARDEDILATDAIYMARLFVIGGFTYDIRNELSYIHSVHKGSSWIQNNDACMKIWNSTNWKI